MRNPPSLAPSIFSSGWIQVGSDIDGREKLDCFGHSVSMSSEGTTVAIGAPCSDGNGENSGYVRVFEFEDGAWVQLGSDIDGEEEDDSSGYSVSMSSDGRTVAIGANDLNGGLNDCHVRVYKFVDGAWVQLGSDIDGEREGAVSGRHISMSSDGRTVAIESYDGYGGGGHGLDSGHVRVYQFVDGAWVQLGSDIDGERVGDAFGSSISMSSDGRTVAIGALGNGGNGLDSGLVRVYQFVDGAWVQLGSDIDGEESGDLSGMTVSMSSDGRTVAIGAPFNDGNGLDSGHVRVYEFEDGAWVQLGSDIDGEREYDHSGHSVSMSSDGRTVAIGAPKPINDGNGLDSGHVRVYQFVDGAWVQLGSDIDGESSSNGFGYHVSMSSDGRTVAIAEPYGYENRQEFGHVRVFRFGQSV
jgi:hypothetical protein